MLNPEELERYARHIVMREVGGPGQAKLKAARVLVVGAGGLGAPALMYLAAAGVGTLGVIDDDTVSLSNLQRQVIHATADVGRAKTDSARERIAAINPHVAVRTHNERLDAGNALALLAGYDVVADGSDNFATRYLLVGRVLSREEDAGDRRARRVRRVADDDPRPRPATRKGAPIRPIAACFRSRRRRARCRPARRPACSARSPACSAR